MPTTKKAATKTTAKSVAKKSASKTNTKTAAKKAATKTPAAKPTKKVATKKTAKTAAKSVGKSLVCAPDKKCFWTNDGQVLRDLREFAAALENMTETVFKHHVAKDRNDFADWVDVVLADTDCAAALRKSKKPSSAHSVVVKHLRVYNL